MYRVLIVDDEEPVLDSYEFMITSTDDFAVAGKARSGYESLKLIYELEPDLVLMDINIPGMDGIQVISEVYRKFPSMVFVLSTAYERFDLARRAIPLGIFAYLVKPVSKKTFLNTLDSVREELHSRTAGSIPSATGEDERRFLQKTIWKEMGRNDWEQFRDRFSFPSDKVTVCLIDLEGDPEKWCPSIFEKLSYRHSCRFDTMLNRGLFLIFGDIRRDDLEKRIEAILTETLPKDSFRSYGLGGLYPGEDLYRSCGEALEDLQRKRNLADVQMRERLRIIQLRRKMGIASPEDLTALFNTLWEEVFSVHDFTVAKAKMASVFLFLIDDYSGCYSGHSEELPPLNPHEDSMGISSLEEWETWALRSFDYIVRISSLRRSDRFPPPLAKALEFIHGHYTEGIQLSSAAEAANVSAAYLSRLFAEHLGTSFIDYITELRVEQAERLIRETKMNIKEVSFAVGYQDPNYFSKIFRRATGLPPTLYAAEKRDYSDSRGEECV
ncbi:response regulator transcription factor [Breznakiella homolactica]|uniref:Helix-turn-helix domain-containing protein n=1 Tax=Breznakiella homolactica TaxID=2798577 RepID=A0A7T7XRF2_9SPIR|nr:helix-turn-helix domain-containing protein [Breznakiella homolactica]QQO11023.1 helix-turn-helix domain-containing protein [Breznakiella homolactica]